MYRLMLFLLPLSSSLADTHYDARYNSLRSSAPAIPTIEKTIIYTAVRKRHDLFLTPRNATQGHWVSGPVSSFKSPSSGVSIGEMATVFSWPAPSSKPLGAVMKRSAESTSHQHDDETTTIATVFLWPVSSSVSPKAQTKRSANLYALHISLGEKEGNMDLFLPNTTALWFCKNVPDVLYNDSLKTFHGLGLRVGDVDVVIPVREEQAEEFCQSVKKDEKANEGLDPTKTANGVNKRPNLVSQDGATATKSDAGGSAMETPALKPGASKTIAPTPTRIALDEARFKDAPEQHKTEVSASSPKQGSTSIDLLSLTLTKNLHVDAQATPPSASSEHTTSVDGAANDVFVPEKDYKVKSKAIEGSITSLSNSSVLEPITPPTPPAQVKAADATASPVSQDAAKTPSLTESSINTWAEYIKSYMDSATSTNFERRSVLTGTAIPQPSSNAAVPQPNRSGIWTQLVRRRPRNLEPADNTVEAESREDGVMPQDPDDLFVAPQKSSSSTAAATTTTADTTLTSSARIPAKARPGITADPTDMPSATPISRRPGYNSAPTPVPEDAPFNDPDLLDEISAGYTPTFTSQVIIQESGVTIKKKPRPSPTQVSSDADGNKDKDADSNDEDTSSSTTTSKHAKPTSSISSPNPSPNSNPSTGKDSNFPSIPIPKSNSNNNSSSSSTRYYQTSWGQTNYPEMRVSLYVLWGMVGLQVLCGVSEFRRMAFGEWDLGTRG
jgi:hypothetical protein